MNSTARGGRPTSPLLRRAVELLEDGQPHDVEEILREVGKLVAPGRALRRNEQDRRLSSGREERKVDRSKERLIRAGQRSIARDVLQKSYFVLEPAGHAPNKTVRLTHIPPRIAEERRREAANRLFLADIEADKLMASEDPRGMLHDMTQSQLERLALELRKRLEYALLHVAE